MMQRPTGVTIVAVLAAIGGVFGILGSLGLILGGSLVGGLLGGAVGGLFVIGGLILLGLSIAELVLAYGLWMLRPWAWTYSVVFAAVRVLVALLGIVGFVFYESFTSLLVTVVISAIWLYYLNMPEIRKAFAAPDKGWPFIGNVGT